MVGVTQAGATEAPVEREIEDERLAGGAAAVLPTALAVILLLVASSSNGAFALRDWGPLAVFCLVALTATRIFPISRPALAMAGAAWGYALWSVLSVTWAQVPGNAIEGGARNALYAALVSLPLLTVPTRRWALRLGLGLAAGLGVLVIGTLVALHADGASHFLAGRLNDPVGYRNGTAALFALAFWPLVCVAARRMSHVLLRASCFTLALIALGLAFLTQSRGVLLGFAGGGLVAVALGPDRLRRTWLALLVVAGLAVQSHALLAPFDAFLATNATAPAAVDRATNALTALAAVGFAVGMALALLDGGLRVSASAARSLRLVAGGALVVLTLAAGVVGIDRAGNPVTLLRDKVTEFKQLDAPAPGETRLGSTGGQRYDLWRIALDEFRSAPLNGVGEGSYEPGYYAERRTDRNLDTPHSLVMQLLAETGLIGFALVAAMLVAAALALARGWRGATADERRAASALAAGSAVMLTQSAVDWLWLIPGLIGLALLSLGLAVAIVARPREATELRARATPPVRAVPVLAALLVASLVLSDLYVRTARAETGATSAHRSALARTAGRLDPFSVTPRYLEAGALEEQGHRAAARAKLLGALDLEPRSFVTLGLLGDLETRAGHPAAAKAYYRRALARNPRDTGLQQLAR